MSRTLYLLGALLFIVGVLMIVYCSYREDTIVLGIVLGCWTILNGIAVIMVAKHQLFVQASLLLCTIGILVVFSERWWRVTTTADKVFNGMMYIGAVVSILSIISVRVYVPDQRHVHVDEPMYVPVVVPEQNDQLLVQQQQEPEESDQPEKPVKAGLWFGDNHVIKQLSGPVSLVIMTPPADSGLPVVMLWGDTHDSDENLCSPCSHAESQCFKVWGKRLYQMLDKVDAVIDIFTEHAEIPITFSTVRADRDLRHDSPMTRFHYNTMFDCLRPLHSRRPINRPCATQNLRWHMSDVRYGTILDRTVNPIRNRPSLEMAVGELLLQEFFEDAPSGFSSDDFEPFENSVQAILKSSNLENGIDQVNINEFIHTFIAEVTRPENRKKSLIAKQWHKSRLSLSATDLEDMMTELTYIHMSLMKNSVNIPLLLTASFLDMYFILRMLKQPEGGKVSDLSIGYFGHAHVVAISNVLMEQRFGYDVVYSIPKNNFNRCLTITEEIDMLSLLRAKN